MTGHYAAHTHSHSLSSCSYNKLKKETQAKKQQTQRPAHKDFFAHTYDNMNIALRKSFGPYCQRRRQLIKK